MDNGFHLWLTPMSGGHGLTKTDAFIQCRKREDDAVGTAVYAIVMALLTRFVMQGLTLFVTELAAAVFISKNCLAG